MDKKFTSNKPTKKRTKEQIIADLKLDLKRYRKEYYRLSKLVSQQTRIRGTLSWSRLRNTQFEKLRTEKRKITNSLNKTKKELKLRGVTL